LIERGNVTPDGSSRRQIQHRIWNIENGSEGNPAGSIWAGSVFEDGEGHAQPVGNDARVVLFNQIAAIQFFTRALTPKSEAAR